LESEWYWIVLYAGPVLRTAVEVVVIEPCLHDSMRRQVNVVSVVPVVVVEAVGMKSATCAFRVITGWILYATVAFVDIIVIISIFTIMKVDLNSNNPQRFLSPLESHLLLDGRGADVPISVRIVAELIFGVLHCAQINTTLARTIIEPLLGIQITQYAVYYR
jgi:hypothetical protein